MQRTDELIKVKDLSCIDLDIEDRAQAGGMITHEAHNKTKGVGQFAVYDIHIGQNVPFSSAFDSSCW